MLQLEAPTFEHHSPLESLGIGESSPRISWRFTSSAQDWVQKSYEIQIRRFCKIEGEDHETHESATEISSESVLVPWPSTPLKSRERAYVRVKACGVREFQNTAWSSWTQVEMGLLEKEDWKAEFIEAPRILASGGSLRPALFRKGFNLEKGVKKARLYATAHGLYEVLLNGNKVGDELLAPGWTSYKYHLNYQTYDVTGFLEMGQNAIGAEVAEGWWAGRLAWEERWRFIYGNTLGVIAQLEIEYEDGETVLVCTDNSWQTSTGGLISAEIYDGTAYDASQELTGWSTGNFKTTNWSPVTTAGLGDATLQAPEGPPVRATEIIKIKQIIHSPSNKVILDFGQNLVGFLRVKISGPRGHKITFHHVEVLENSEIATGPLRSAKATDSLILSGKSIIWEPKFTFHGFRYAQIDNWPSHRGVPGFEDIVAVVIHTDLERTGTFTCSDPMINHLHENIVWGMRGNFVSIPTDCPQRDERLGWTGDLQVFCKTANYLYKTSGMLSGWLKDLSVEQADLNGIVANIVPNPLPPEHNRPQAAWCDVAILTPWVLYHSFGDLKILRNQYDSMSDWLTRGVRRKENGLWDESERQLGDWLDPDAPPTTPEFGKTPPYYVANAYLVHVTNILSKISLRLSLYHEAEHWASEAARLKKLFQEQYIAPDGSLKPDTQTSITLAVSYNLLPYVEDNASAGARLDAIVRANGFRIGTGFVGTPLILPVLRFLGRMGLAYKMLEERQCPSWMYPITMGATTQWERWDSLLPDGHMNISGMTSFNHYALGSVAAFLHTSIGGIAPLSPGYKETMFSPLPGGSVTSAKATFVSPYGLVECEWALKVGQVEARGDGDSGVEWNEDEEEEEVKIFWIKVRVPMNCTAVIRFPGKEKQERSVKSGVYEFVIPYDVEDLGDI